MTYTLHIEWTDGTFEAQPFSEVIRTKKEACRFAKSSAADIKPWSQIARILVCDVNLTTVAAFDRSSVYVHDIPHTAEQRIAAGYEPL